MDDHCPTCGQRLSELHIEGGSAAPHQHHNRRPPGERRAGVLLTLLAVAALVAVVTVATTADDTPPAEEPESAAPPVADEPGDSDDDRIVTFGRRLSGNVDELRRLIGDHTLAYLGDDTVVIVDPNASVAVRELAPGEGTLPDYVFRLADFGLLVGGSEVFGVLPATGEAVRLSSAGPLVRDAFGGFAIISDRESAPTEMLLSSGARMDLSSLLVPAGSGRLDVQDVGVLVTPPSGGTFRARPAGFEPFADGVVLAATPSHHLEATCDEALECEIALVDREHGTRTALPEELSGGERSYALSPGGRWLLIESSDGAMRLYDTDEGTIDDLPVAVPLDVAWAGDDSVVVWFAPGTRRPILQAFTPATLTFETIDLGDLRAVDRTGDAIALLEPA